MSKKSNSFQNWKKVWNSRTIELNSRSQLLDELIKANGFDTGVGDYSTEDWQILTAFLAKKFSLNNNSKVFEIGCGSGAFLYSLKQHSGCKISGVDYSQPLIKIAQENIDGDFKVCDAKDNWRLKAKVDYIIAHSVFNYFPDMEYVAKVLENTFLNLKKGGFIALLDLNNLEKEREYHDLRKKLYVTPEKYEEKYELHSHLFFSIDSLVSTLEEIGFKNIKLFENPCKNYLNSQFRFNLMAKQ